MKCMYSLFANRPLVEKAGFPCWHRPLSGLLGTSFLSLQQSTRDSQRTQKLLLALSFCGFCLQSATALGQPVPVGMLGGGSCLSQGRHRHKEEGRRRPGCQQPFQRRSPYLIPLAQASLVKLPLLPNSVLWAEDGASGRTVST